MSAKHTPGPWSIRKCDAEIGPGQGEYIVCAFNEYLITSTSETDGNEKADAKLIAAAPLLAGALRRLLAERDALWAARRVAVRGDPQIADDANEALRAAGVLS